MPKPPKAEMIRGFIEEVKSYIPSLADGLDALRTAPDKGEMLEETHRLVHTIKGAASMVGLTGLSKIALQMEDYLDDIIAGKQVISDRSLAAMHKTTEKFQEYCRCYLNGGVASRTMFKETVTDFARVRGLSLEEEEKILSESTEAIPEIEALEIEGENVPEAGMVQDTADISSISAEPDDMQEDDTLFPPDAPAGQCPIEIEEVAGESRQPASSRIEFPPELMESFYEEAEEHLEDLARSLKVIESQATEPIAISAALREEIRKIRRSVHTLKGAAAVMRFQEFADRAHELEDVLDWLYEEAREISPEIVAVLTEASDLLAGLVASPSKVPSSKVQSLQNEYQKIMGLGLAAVQTDLTSAENQDEQELISDLNEILQAEAKTEDAEAAVFSEEASPVDESAGPHPRSSRTLRVDMARIDELVNLAGELIIALSGFEQKMEIFADSTHDLELSCDRIKNVARDLEVNYEVKALDQLRAVSDFSSAARAASLPAGGFDDFDSLELDRYSELNLIIRMMNETTVDLGALNGQLTNLYREFDGHLLRQRVVLSELQEKMMLVRMTPMSIITSKLHRTVREVAGELGKKIRLIITGENIELDRMIWEKLTDPLMHLLRNAVDHGVEAPAERASLQKASVATINLDAFREGNQVVIRIADDGAGLNFRAIREAAGRMQLADHIDEMSEDELSRFIFFPGFSTRSQINAISGRGVGMDVVKENILNLKGAIRVSSEPGRGTRFTIRIPLTLAVVRALLFTAGGQKLAIALNEIREIIRLAPENVLGPHQDAVRLKDEILPLFQISDLLHTGKSNAASAPASKYPIALVIESGGRRAALVIDMLVGQREIVIKGLGSHLRYVKGISGVTIMGDGGVVPILNLEELLWSQTAIGTDIYPDAVPDIKRPLKIMVVDDSISVRQVISRLLADQGWEVQTAKDGIDGLDKLREDRPDLIVLDIEMPRMNGYEFLGAVKTQSGYEDIPVVMLTSRATAKHREKARGLGASGFIVKPYKDDEFIDLINKLTGGSTLIEMPQAQNGPSINYETVDH